MSHLRSPLSRGGLHYEHPAIPADCSTTHCGGLGRPREQARTDARVSAKGSAGAPPEVLLRWDGLWRALAFPTRNAVSTLSLAIARRAIEALDRKIFQIFRPL